MEVWFNPSCSKSRHAVAELEAAGVRPGIRRYLDEPPTAAELEALLDALGLQPWDIARTGEPAAADAGLAGLPLDRARWVEVLVAHPVLLQRPILVGRDAAGITAAIEHERTTR